jgi:Fe-S cluster assembly protein SufD
MNLLALAEAAAEKRPAEPAWLEQRRASALASFRDQGLPTTKLEAWRYTNLAALGKTSFEHAAPAAEVSREAIERVCFPVFACSLYVFLDGRYREELSAPRALSGNTRVQTDPELARSHLGALVDPKQHPLAALNTALFEDVAVLRVPRDTRIEQPVHVVFASSGGTAPHVRHPRLLVVAEEGSQVQVVQDHVCLDETGADGGFSNSVCEVVVEANAQVDLVVVQRETDGFHVSNLGLRLERDARLTSNVITLGGRLVRNDLAATLAGEGCDATLNGLFVGSGERVVDNHTLVDHAVPHGTSRQLYRGILGGASRGVFRGRVVVRPDAQKTNAQQSNPNLLLCDAAEVDTRPQLEIHADDVKCSHGSTVGQLDDDALFYLRARGISEQEARGLLTRGFAHQVLDALPVAALREGLDEHLDRSLAEANA